MDIESSYCGKRLGCKQKYKELNIFFLRHFLNFNSLIQTCTCLHIKSFSCEQLNQFLRTSLG